MNSYFRWRCRSESAFARKTRVEGWLRRIGVEPDESFSTVMDEESARWRRPDHVASRAVLIANLAAIAHGRLLLDQGLAWIRAKGLWKYTTTWDRSFLTEVATSEWSLLQRKWLGESAWALLWTIGAVERLTWPATTCDAEVLSEIVPGPGEDPKPFIRLARLRPPMALLDQVDLYWRLYHLPSKRLAAMRKQRGWTLHWDVVLERSRALWWLTGCQQRWGDPQMLP